MEKECCNIKITGTEDGLRIDIKGEGLKEKCEAVFKNCCSDDTKKSGFQSCCGSGK
ncbi:MAG: hypothetical protein HZA10_09210 [Nitrospirae bacterium]|nr:hypothetical protein [Nitrospirota bacterium]